MRLLTAEQIHKKYFNKYIEVYRTYDHIKQVNMYEVLAIYNVIHENTTLGQDVGTPLMYRR